MKSENNNVSHAELLELKRWNTPTIYNGWEQITTCDPGKDGFNLEPTTDFMPEMGPMVGYAVTAVIEPGNPIHQQKTPHAWSEYRRYVASAPYPKIVVVQDMDEPGIVGSFWGEVNSSIHHALGCVGTICDGAIRDLDEMRSIGFKALARRLCVGHAYSHPVRWGCEVEVFGRAVKPGQLIHADKHGFLVIPKQDEARLLKASCFMDTNECRTMIRAARETAGKSVEEILQEIDTACDEFTLNVNEHFGQ